MTSLLARAAGALSNRGRVGPREWRPEWLSYSKALDSRPVHFLWRRTFCRLSVHLFDQVESNGSKRLYCDACGCEMVLRSGRIVHGDADE